MKQRLAVDTEVPETPVDPVVSARRAMLLTETRRARLQCQGATAALRRAIADLDLAAEADAAEAVAAAAGRLAGFARLLSLE